MNKFFPRIKICGVKDLSIVDYLLELDVEFIGINFIENSKRYIKKDLAHKISKKFIANKNSSSKLVGLFQNHDHNKVNEKSTQFNLDYVQLCGDEDLNYLQKIKPKIIKTVHIDNSQSIEEINNKIIKYSQVAEYIILDKYSSKYAGGTGKTFDWKKFQSTFAENIFVAGGLNPKNIEGLVNKYNPWGVDVSSGIETDNKKDINKIKDFVEKARKIYI